MTDDDHQPGADRVSDRGFTAYGPGPITDSTGHTIDLYESSSAASVSGPAHAARFDRGPFVWIRIETVVDDPDPAVHLNRAAVVELHARMGRWLEEHPALDEPVSIVDMSDVFNGRGE